MIEFSLTSHSHSKWRNEKKNSIEKPVPNSSDIIKKKKKKTSVKISKLFKQSQFAKTDFHEQVMLITCLVSLSLFSFPSFSSWALG